MTQSSVLRSGLGPSKPPLPTVWWSFPAHTILHPIVHNITLEMLPNVPPPPFPLPPPPPPLKSVKELPGRSELVYDLLIGMLRTRL